MVTGLSFIRAEVGRSEAGQAADLSTISPVGEENYLSTMNVEYAIDIGMTNFGVEKALVGSKRLYNNAYMARLED